MARQDYGFIDPNTGKPVKTTASKNQPIPPATATGLTAGMEPLSGWAGQMGFNPSQLQQTIYQSPFSILPKVFGGLNLAGPGYQALRDIGADPLSLYNIMTGSKTAVSDKTGLSDFTNWLRNMYSSYGSTKGGRAFSAQELLGNLFGQTEKSQSSLANILRGAGQGGQASVLYNLIRDITAVGMNPLAAAGYNSAAQRASDAYNTALISSPANQGANNMLITDWIRQNVPGLLPTR